MEAVDHYVLEVIQRELSLDAPPADGAPEEPIEDTGRRGTLVGILR